MNFRMVARNLLLVGATPVSPRQAATATQASPLHHEARQSDLIGERLLVLRFQMRDCAARTCHRKSCTIAMSWSRSFSDF